MLFPHLVVRLLVDMHRRQHVVLRRGHHHAIAFDKDREGATAAAGGQALDGEGTLGDWGLERQVLQGNVICTRLTKCNEGCIGVGGALMQGRPKTFGHAENGGHGGGGGE